MVTWNETIFGSDEALKVCAELCQRMGLPETGPPASWKPETAAVARDILTKHWDTFKVTFPAVIRWAGIDHRIGWQVAACIVMASGAPMDDYFRFIAMDAGWNDAQYCRECEQGDSGSEGPFRRVQIIMEYYRALRDYQPGKPVTLTSRTMSEELDLLMSEIELEDLGLD